MLPELREILEKIRSNDPTITEFDMDKWKGCSSSEVFNIFLTAIKNNSTLILLFISKLDDNQVRQVCHALQENRALVILNLTPCMRNTDHVLRYLIQLQKSNPGLIVKIGSCAGSNITKQLDEMAEKKYERAHHFLQAAHQGNLEVVRYLLAEGVRVNSYDSNYMTALHLAAKRGHLAVVKCLIDHGASLYFENEQKQTALALASSANQYEVVNYLTKLGASASNVSTSAELLPPNQDNIFTLSSLSINNKTSEEWFQEGWECYKKGEYANAIEAYEQALRLNNNFYYAWTNKALAQIYKGDYQAALISSKEALRLAPHDKYCLYHYALAFDSIGHLDSALDSDRKNLLDFALEAYNKVLEADNKFLAALVHQGIIYENLGARERAEECFKKAIELPIPDDHYLLFSQGIARVCYEGEKMDDYHVMKLFEIDKNDCKAYYLQGLMFMKKNNGEVALASFRAAFNLNPNYRDPFSHQSISEACERLAKSLAASSLPTVTIKNAAAPTPVVSATVKPNPSVIEIITQANNYYEEGNYNEALKLYRRAALQGDETAERRVVSIEKLLREIIASSSKIGTIEALSPAPISATVIVADKQKYENRPDDKGQIKISIAIPASELTLGRELGKGTYGVVYQGERHDTPVAIKKLSFNQELKKSLLENFMSEVTIMANLRSPYIVQLYGACFEVSNYALVMEFCPRGSLYNLLQSDQQLSWPLRYQMAIDIGCGVSYLHNYQVVHGDLKSVNVLLDKDFNCKISDFGLSKIKLNSSASTIGPAQGGTTRWMAPELFEEKAKNTQASDMYSYGMVLWELGARKIPFHEKAPREHALPFLLVKGTREDITSDTPPSMAKLIVRCWEQRVDLRPSAKEAVKVLKESHHESIPEGKSAGYRPNTFSS